MASSPDGEGRTRDELIVLQPWWGVAPAHVYPLVGYPFVAYVYVVTPRRSATVAGSDLFTGSLDLIVLKAVSFGPLHGYAIAHWIRHSTKEGLEVREGALYPSLHRLEGKGFLAGEWGMTDTNREAKFYRLTPAGKKQLAAELDRWHGYSRIMTLALAASKLPD